MKTATLPFLVSLLFSFTAYGQKVEELFHSKNFDEIVKYEKKADELSGRELYMVGYAFFRQENDAKAIEFYDKAIAKGLDSAYVHFYKGLSLNYMKKYNEAIPELDIAIKAEPESQEYLAEKGISYYRLDKLDKALEIFEKAETLPNNFQTPFYYVPHIYNVKKEFDKALKGFYEALDKISPDNEYYLSALEDIGRLEFTHTKNYEKSAQAYTQAIAIDKENYELYYKLMKSYNAGKQTAKADSVFAVVKDAFDHGKLPKEDMEIKTVAIAQFEWNGQIAAIRRSLVTPKEVLDISYKVFVLNKEGDKVERKFLIEKATEIPGGAKYLLCEKDKKNGDHITYPYGWNTDVISCEELEKGVRLVLDGKMEKGASSNFGSKD